jgi:hypothetical protein
VDDIKKYFGKSRKIHLDDPLKSFGFKPYKSSFLARLTEEAVFQFIDVHKYRYGGQFTINVAIRPLYCPHEDYLTLQPGNRLYSMATKGRSDKWWPNTTENETDESFKEVFHLILDHALPFFDATITSAGIIKSYEKNFFGKSKFGKSVSWGGEGWGNFDFGHIYLKAGDKRNVLKQFDKAYKEFKTDNRDWAQSAAEKCLKVKRIIGLGQIEIDKYLDQTLIESKTNLKLSQW